jgi:hypothetical protein
VGDSQVPAQGGTRCPQRVSNRLRLPRDIFCGFGKSFTIGPSRTGIFRRSRSTLTTRGVNGGASSASLCAPLHPGSASQSSALHGSNLATTVIARFPRKFLDSFPLLMRNTATLSKRLSSKHAARNRKDLKNNVQEKPHPLGAPVTSAFWPA